MATVEGIKPVKYVSDEADFVAVYELVSKSVVPVVMVPTSERAKELAAVWGLEETSTGLAAPDNVEDFLNGLPGDWTLGYESMKPGEHVVQKIALPQPLHVLH